jgi:uracil phosphoribosyltransferase
MPHIVSENPLAKYYLTVLRDKRTPPKVFREYLKKLGFVLAQDAARFIEWKPVSVETPIAVAEGLMPSESVAIVAILRAGLPMAEGVLEALDWASLGLMAAKRIEDGEIYAKVYYENVPKADAIIVVDPMIATGSTLVESLAKIKDKARKVIVIGAIAAPEGLKRIEKEFPEALIIVASVDAGLNDKAFIIPGLGDAGDRAFGTIKTSGDAEDE